MKHQINNARGQQVGYVEDAIYNTTRDYNKGQIFINPKYKSAIGLDVSILQRLVDNKVHTIRVMVSHFEKRTFTLQVDIMYFVKNSTVINFDKKINNNNLTHYSKQRILPMNEWDRWYPTQKVLA